MIYGPNNKGNLPRLAWLAMKVPVFPAWHNKRSMLHVDNLAEFVKQLILRDMSADDKAQFDAIGTSCHSVEDAIEAQALGAGYIIAGHIFETECKKGLAGRGTDFLKEICNTVKLPVYAIGGISADNAAECIKAGADGICLMSSFMQAEDVSEFMDRLRGVMNG